MTPRLDPAFLRIPLAHRALHDVAEGRPENSRAAICAAISAGYGIEIDIQASADHQAFVFHDYDLSRLSQGKGQISAKPASELVGIPLKGAPEGIPTLRDVVELVAGQVPLLIEVKDQDGSMGPDVGPLEESVALAIRGYKGPIAVMSYNPYSTKHLARLLPDVARGLVTDSFDPAEKGLPEAICVDLRAISEFQNAGCSFISHDHVDLARPRVSELKASGADILCWTIKTPEQEAEARKIAQNITFEQYLAPFPA